ncbi:MAG: hypothetical protein JWN84_730 [Nocardioides sp.]|nr:hypothetical protein [Nocardioides sp.]
MRIGRTLALGALLVPVTAGCSTFSDPAPSTGVDELVVPTPSPDPADFVAEVDNPWFVLDDATFADASGRAVEREVDAGPQVLGVPTTAVTLAGATDLFAQDADGNVWWFGHQDDGTTGWEAGRDGAEAGLVMAAEPRRGDGYRLAEVPGQEWRAEVLEVDRATVLVEVVADGATTVQRYTRGAGLDTVETGTGDVLLARQEEGE